MVPPQPHHVLSTYYRAADLTIVPSRSESFGSSRSNPRRAGPRSSRLRCGRASHARRSWPDRASGPGPRPTRLRDGRGADPRRSDLRRHPVASLRGSRIGLHLDLDGGTPPSGLRRPHRTSPRRLLGLTAGEALRGAGAVDQRGGMVSWFARFRWVVLTALLTVAACQASDGSPSMESNGPAESATTGALPSTELEGRV